MAQDLRRNNFIIIPREQPDTVFLLFAETQVLTTEGRRSAPDEAEMILENPATGRRFSTTVPILVYDDPDPGLKKPGYVVTWSRDDLETFHPFAATLKHPDGHLLGAMNTSQGDRAIQKVLSCATK
jgi:hypothetical protein